MHQSSKQGRNSDNTRREDGKKDDSTRIWDARAEMKVDKKISAVVS